MPVSVLPESGRSAPEKRRMPPRSLLLWIAVSLLGAIAWGVLALARGEEISAVWLVVAALGSYAIAYRFYSRFVARRVLRPDDRRATPAERLEDGVDFHPTDRRVLLGHHFAAIMRRRTAGGAGARGADGLPARDAVDRRRDLRGRGAGHGRAVPVHATGREVARADGAGRDRPVGRGRRPDRRVRHHDHPAGRAGPGRRQRPRPLPVGHLLRRDDHPHRPVHGLLAARHPPGPGRRDQPDRRRAAAARHRRRELDPAVLPGLRLHAEPHDPGVLPGRLRLRRLRAAGVDAARAARLPLHLHEDRHDRAARGGRGGRRPGAARGRRERLRLVGRGARLQPARSSPSSSSPSPAARCPASTPWSPPAPRRS